MEIYCHIPKFSANVKKLKTVLILLLLSFQALSIDTTLVDFIHLNQNIKSIANDSTGKIWISGGFGLQFWDGNEFIVTDKDFYDYIIEYEGRVIPVSEFPNPILFKYTYPWERSKSWKNFLPEDPNYISEAIDEDSLHWIACGSDIFIFKIDDRFTHSHVGHSTRGIIKHKEDLYVNSYSGLFKNNQIAENTPTVVEGRNMIIQDQMYISGERLFKYDLNTAEIKQYMISHHGRIIPSGIWHKINHVVEINDTLIVATDNGIGFVKEDTLICNTKEMRVEDIAYANGRILFAGRDGIGEFKNGKTDIIAFAGYHCNQITLKEDKYYIPSNFGLIIWDGEAKYEIINKSNGLSHDICHSAIFDDHGFLWISTNMGLNRMDMSTGVITHYLNNVEFNKRSFHKSGNQLFFGGVNGVFSFYPEKFLGDEKIIIDDTYKVFQYLIPGLILILLLIMILIYQNAKRESKSQKTEISDLKRINLILKVENYIFNHPNIHLLTVNHIAEFLDISDRTLYRACQEMGIKPGELLKNLKLKKSRSMIESGQYSSYQEVARKIGYSDQYFVRLYKSKFGIDLKKLEKV